MKVKELKEALEKADDDLEVIIERGDEDEPRYLNVVNTEDSRDDEFFVLLSGE